jgi:pimeloyl-ACP methyl ester carboxylesterase
MVVLLALLVSAVAAAGLLSAWSYPGRPRPFLDRDGRPALGSIAEKIRVEVNGIDQAMLIKARDSTKPVLLYLHGGMPDYFLTERYPTGLEDHFVVCWWEQRGAGMSYSSDIPRETMTVEQLIADTTTVTHYLRRRFGQEKIYLMGHSGGTFVGIQAAARTPELYHAYVGVAQVSNQLRSEWLAYEYMLGRLKAQGNLRLARRLQAAPVTLEKGVPLKYLSVRDEAMHALGVGTTRDMRSVMTGIFWASLRCRQYTLREKLSTWRGKIASGVSPVWREMLCTDLTKRLPEAGVPVYFFHGVHDHTCSYVEARAYFDELRAPLKGFYSFAQSAHSPVFEEPDRALKILLEDVLAGTNRLADRSRSLTGRPHSG